jgi:hypothetical protein
MLRVSDAEREATAETLRTEHVNGRLDVAEFQERLERCLAAKTYADLDALVVDLPGSAPPRDRRTFVLPPRPWPVLLLPLVVLAVVASHGRALWLVFPFLCFFVLRPLLWGSWRGHRGRW